MLTVITLFNKIYNFLLLRHSRALIGERFVVNGRLLIRGNGKIVIGDDVRINSGLFYNPIGGDNKMILFTKKGGRIILGNRVAISNSAIVSSLSVEIEDDVMIGGGVKIYDTDFHSLNFEERISKCDLNEKSDKVKIKKGAFLGAHTIVLKGVTVGEKSIVGAGSVVTRDIPDFEIWAGNPVKFIRKLEE